MRRGHTIDPETGIWPVAEWGPECARGFVSDRRFGPGLVIKRTDREVTRRWLRARDRLDPMRDPVIGSAVTELEEFPRLMAPRDRARSE